MSDERDPVDVSLQRLFAPPELGALQAKIDAAAAAAELPRIEPARAVAPRDRARTVWIAAFAAAAAAALVLLFSAREEQRAAPPEPEPEPAAVAVLGARQHAGAQLARFHAAGVSLPQPDETSCLGAPPPPPSCIDDPRQPRLSAADDLEVIGECGVGEGPGCAGYDLPAARLVHLRLRPNGPDVLVCVEPRELDPQPLLPDDAGLSIFRRELGTFVLYEITPLSEPRALDLFTL